MHYSDHEQRQLDIKSGEAMDRRQCETPMSDHVARFWQHLETETVRILVDLKRTVGTEAPDGPVVYWDCGTFSDDVAKGLVADRKRLEGMHRDMCGVAGHQGEKVEALMKERDLAQSTCQAWQHVYEGIEAHLQDRINCKDPADPERYLAIIRASVAGVLRGSQQICAARWADYARADASIVRLEAEIERLNRILSATRELLGATEVELQAARA